MLTFGFVLSVVLTVGLGPRSTSTVHSNLGSSIEHSFSCRMIPQITLELRLSVLLNR